MEISQSSFRQSTSDAALDRPEFMATVKPGSSTGKHLSVDISVAGKFHAFHLASALSVKSRLRDLYSAHRNLLPPPGVPNGSYHNRIDFAAWGHLSRFLPLGYTGERRAEKFDNWVAKKLLRRAPGVLHAWNGNSIETFRQLRGRGWRLCVERSCPHNLVQFELLREEASNLGMIHQQDMRALDRAIEELHLADVIVAPSTYSARSYGNSDLARKVRVNPLGANVPYRERNSPKGPLKIVMVGNSFLRKGTHYLIEAFKQMRDPDARLWIRGDVPDTYRPRVRDSRITIFPPMLPDALRRLYQSANVFVQASIDEGFGMAVFEALGYGLPLVVTENVGANDLLNKDVAITVPIRDPDALVRGIEAAVALPGENFDKARKQVLEANSWLACAERMLDTVYR